MLKRYKKGMTTRNNIIHVAKTLFYFNGYKKTTVQKISNLANVNLGLLSYYFKTKKNIVKICFLEYLDRINAFVSENVDDIDDTMLLFLIEQRIYFNLIFKNQNNLSFYKEVVCNKIVYDVMYDFALDKYNQISEKMNLDLKENIVKCYVSLTLGGRCKVLLSYFDKEIDIDYNDLINVIISYTPKLFGIDKVIIDNYITKSEEIVKNLDCDSINFLINNN